MLHVPSHTGPARPFFPVGRFALKKLDKKRLKLKHQEASAVHERNVLAEVCVSPIG